MEQIRPIIATSAESGSDCSEQTPEKLHGWKVASWRSSLPTGKSVIEQLQHSEQRLADFLDTAADRLWEMDADLRLTFVSPGRLDSMLAPELVLGKTRWEIAGVDPDCDASWRAHVADLMARKPFRDFEFKTAGPNSESRYHSVSGIPLFDKQGVFIGYRGTVRDITALRMAHQRIEHLAFHDDLTGLPNRRHLKNEFRRIGDDARRDGTQIGMMLLDIDHFKDINDTLGHSLGDKLLIEVARRLEDNVDRHDLLARIGGDEFAIVAVSQWEKERLGAMAERIIKAMAEPFTIDSKGVRIGVSVGITVYPDHSADFERTLANADMALYAAKNAGRHTWHMFDDALHRGVQIRHRLDQELRRAWQFGEFALHYQPLICTRRAKVAGFEALIRWQHKQRGCLLPDTFLSTLELSPILEPLTRWTLRTALAERQKWQSQGFGNLNIAVNIPSATFHGADLLTTIDDCLKQTGAPPEALTLEISERALIDLSTTVPVLDALRELGVVIAIDDFGMGYSSLSRLKSLPVDVLKIDRSFLANVAEGGQETVIAELLIKMGHSLGKKVVVEGVETEEQVAFLDTIGCLQLQGFLIAPAMPPVDLPHWVKNWQDTSIDNWLERAAQAKFEAEAVRS
ncbi:MAG: putative bifunctional diguanylate cyclase/phosphodiesterase [Geminicoccaceae bacterium]